MTSDERALLAAIVADPADDTVRLAYADCIEEQGNAARAAFIRLQIEAERLHPNSNARARLEAQAEALFAEHWIAWWGEVCATVDFPLPAPKTVGTLGRLARWSGIGAPAGEPFESAGMTVRPWRGRVYDTRLEGWVRSRFRRGFPDVLEVDFPEPAELRFMTRWPTASPLQKVVASSPQPHTWLDGPHLLGLDSLELIDYDPAMLLGALPSPHLACLRELTLRPVEYGDAEVDAWAVELLALNFDLPPVLGHDGETRPFPHELATVFAEPRVRQLERLSLPLPTTRAVEAVANAVNLWGLQTLHVDLSPTEDADPFALDRLYTLAQSPYLAGLRELVVGPVLDPGALRILTRGANWKGLRKLILPNWRLLPGEAWAAFLGDAMLPELEELHLGYVHLDHDIIDVLVQSPVLKQLRHLSLGVVGVDALSDADVRRLADIVDPERIETFALFPDHQMPALEELRKRFGDRLRMP